MRRYRLLIFPAASLLILSCHGALRREAPAAESPAESIPGEMEGSKVVHPEFTFTSESFAIELRDLPERASEDPEDFLNLVSGMLQEERWVLELVDKQNALSAEFIPPGLVSLEEYPDIPQSREGLELSGLAADRLSILCEAADVGGIRLVVSSAYRSWEYQESVFNRYAASDGEEAASRYSARPGESQHQLGTTVDFGDITNRFAESEAGRWISENGTDFGWSLSYPEGDEEETGYIWESWHWRYVGIPAAVMQERYFDGKQQTMLEFWNANRDLLEDSRIPGQPEES